MQIKYLSTAWNDIRQSPGWLAKALLLGLVACIPIFGWIVVYGYLYGWAESCTAAASSCWSSPSSFRFCPASSR